MFQAGWPKEITYAELKPHYDTVAKFMNVQPVPANQWTNRMKLMKEAADKTGAGARFKQLELAVTFDPAWTYDQPNPFNVVNSKRFTNAQGVEQGTCVHLGNCDIGCDADAKNTLDRNYIPWAEKHGAEVRPLHLVTDIQPADGGYKVSFDQLGNGQRAPPAARPRASSSSPPARSARPNCCCAAAKSTAACPTSAPSWAATGARTATSSHRLSTTAAL